MAQSICCRTSISMRSLLGIRSSTKSVALLNFPSVSYCNSANPKRPSNLKGRSPDQQRWLIRQFKDPYVIKSKLASYRSRSAFKLIEIDDRFKFLKPGSRVVDCGAAPGGWTQVAVERVNALGEKKASIGRVVAVDKVFMMPIDGAFILSQHDFTKPETRKAIFDHFGSNSSENGGLIDVVLSDMAPTRTGGPECDHDRVIELCYQAVVFAIQNLAIGGCFLTKLWDGHSRQKLVNDMEKHFEIVSHVKPDASRDDSAEMFLLGRSFKGLKRSQ